MMTHFPFDRAVCVCHAEHQVDTLAILVGQGPGINSVREAQSVSCRDTEIDDLKSNRPGEGTIARIGLSTGIHNIRTIVCAIFKDPIMEGLETTALESPGWVSIVFRNKCAGTKSGTEKSDEMKKFIAGIVIGAAVATAIPALGNNFNSNQNIFSHDRAYRLAYVAGIFDALWAIVEQNYDTGVLRKQYACLDEKSTTLGPLTTWAEYKWQADSHTYNAASVVLADACNP